MNESLNYSDFKCQGWGIMKLAPLRYVDFSLFTDGYTWLFLSQDGAVLTASELPLTHFNCLNCATCPAGFTVGDYSNKKNMDWTLSEALEERKRHHATQN